MSLRTFIGGVLLLVAGLTALDAETAAVPEPGDLRAAGSVDFKVSCAPEVRSEFIRGVALLHSFFYEEARRIFTEVAAKDPTCAMAQWGSLASASRNASSDSSYVNECNSATPRVNDSCPPALHDTGNSTVPSEPFGPWVPCSCSLETLPLDSSSKPKAHSSVIAPLPVFPTFRLLTDFRLPSIVVPSIRRVNPPAVCCTILSVRQHQRNAHSGGSGGRNLVGQTRTE